MRVVPQLIKSGKYIRPALGIEVDEQLNARLPGALTGNKGVFVLRDAGLGVFCGQARRRRGHLGGIVPGDWCYRHRRRTASTTPPLTGPAQTTKNAGDVVGLWHSGLPARLARCRTTNRESDGKWVMDLHSEGAAGVTPATKALTPSSNEYRSLKLPLF